MLLSTGLLSEGSCKQEIKVESQNSSRLNQAKCTTSRGITWIFYWKTLGVPMWFYFAREQLWPKIKVQVDMRAIGEAKEKQ